MYSNASLQYISLPVDKTYGDEEDFFRLITPDGYTVNLKKLPFQRSQPLPDQLTCRVKIGLNGKAYYSHNVAAYVLEFYQQGHQQSKDFEFRVESVPEKSGDPYLIVDNYGIQFKLHDRQARLVVGQNIRCTFSRLDIGGFAIKLSERGLALPLIQFDEALEAIGADRSTRFLLKYLFDNLPELEDARTELAANRSGWILTVLRAINEHMGELFIKADIDRQHKRISAILDSVCNIALYLLEGSAFLRGTSSERRHDLQEELTALTEAMQPYRQALNLIVDGRELDFINSLLSKLERSGFLFHPTLQFTTLMLIFRRRPGHIGELFGRIYDVLMEWSLDTWTNEPFRSAFVEQFELFIREMRRTIDNCPQADTPAEKSRVESMLKALALQLSIADKSTYPHYNRNRSLFYRYAALMRPTSAHEYIHKAFRALQGEFTNDILYQHIKEPALMLTQTAVPLVTPASQSPVVRRFTGTAADIELSGDKITIYSHNDTANTSNILPSGMVEWLSPEIYLNGVKRLTASTIKRIKNHEEFWRNVNEGLTTSDGNDRTEIIRQLPQPGDDVLIVIDGVEDDPLGVNPKFRCHIDDENFEGSGFFFCKSLVGYHMRHIEPWAYMSQHGQPIHLVARVVDIYDDVIEFSLTPTVHNWIEDSVWAGMEVNAVIASHNVETGDYSAISELGIGMILTAPDDLDTDVTLGPQSVVRVMITQTSEQDRVRGTIIGQASPDVRIGKDTAIATLLRNLDYVDDVDYENDSIDECEKLTRDEVREIIELYRLKAVGSDQVLDAYDTLCFGVLLANIIGDESLAAELRLHADLLQLHVDFADNRKVDVEKLEIYRAQITPGSLAERIFRRMEMVSWLGEHTHDHELWLQSQSPASDLEGKFARMILSYNMLVASAMQENEYARRIKDDICALLKVNNERQNLKYYGCESQYAEFKSSMVFCANDGKERTPEETLKRQTFEIMHIIAGFMNTTGGKLYIGVNDQHYERGLEDDFKALHLPYSPDLLKRMDQLQNYLSMRIASYFGRAQATLVKIDVDEESSKGVLIVTVNPSRQPVFLDGMIYVRLSTSTVPITDEKQREQFINSRQLAYSDMMKMRGVEVDEAEAPGVTADEAETAQPTDKPDTGAIDARTPDTVWDKVAGDATKSKPSAGGTEEKAPAIETSAWRPNALHDDDTTSNYVVPELYIYFFNDGTYTLSKQDYYTDMDEACCLALAVRHSELDGYLVLAYEGELLIKVPIAQLLEKHENTALRLWAGAPLKWACIAHDDNAILSVLADTSGGLHYRATSVSDIAKGAMTNPPSKYMNAVVADTVKYELIQPEALPRFDRAMSHKLNSRAAGYTLRTRLDMPDAADKIRKVLVDCYIQ